MLTKNFNQLLDEAIDSQAQFGKYTIRSDQYTRRYQFSVDELIFDKMKKYNCSREEAVILLEKEG